MKNNLCVLLLALMLNRVYSRQTITALFGDAQLASRCRVQALQNGFVKETVYKLRQRTTHTITLYTLTKHGLKYLLDTNEDIFGWLDAEAAQMLNILSTVDRGGKRKFRLSQDTMCMTVAQKAGAYIPMDNYTCAPLSDLQTDDLTIRDVVFAELTPELYEVLLEQSQAQKDILFFRARCIKSFAREKDLGFAAQDHAKGRYNGAIISKYKNVLLYAAPMFGMAWSEWLTKKEYAAFRAWSRDHSIADAEQLRNAGVCAALVVYNEKQFINLYRNVDGTVQAGADFGGSYDHLYIIPQTKEGAAHLRWLMTTDDISMNKEIVADAIDSGAYRKSTKAATSVFQLENLKGERTALGFQLDAKLINRIRDIATRCPEETFGLLCFGWQAPYYAGVLPENVWIATYEMT